MKLSELAAAIEAHTDYEIVEITKRLAPGYVHVTLGREAAPPLVFTYALKADGLDIPSVAALTGIASAELAGASEGKGLPRWG